MRTRASRLADHIQMPDVPARARASVLDCITPYLQDIRLEGGQCFRIAQQLVLAANSSRVKYVEGGWSRAPRNKYGESENESASASESESESESEKIYNDETLVYHAWNLVDGHIVDLTAELYHWNSFGVDSPWIHRSLCQYAIGELHHFDSKYCQGRDAISSHVGSNEIFNGLGISFGVAEFLVDNFTERDFYQDFFEWQESGDFVLMSI